MVVQPVTFTLLNHLFYYTEVSGGPTSASSTGAFIGDLALMYALQNRMKSDPKYYERLGYKKPRLEEVREFGFYCTVARPRKVSRTENYIQNTLFNVDGYQDVKRIEKSGKSPFKNFRQVQGIRLGVSFDALLLSKNACDLPPSIRVGTRKETLVRVEKRESGMSIEEYWLNAYTLKMIFGNWQKASSVMLREKKVNASYVLENYVLLKNMTQGNVEEIFEGVFD